MCDTSGTNEQSYGVWPIDYYDHYALGELAYFSGRGPRRDEVAKPEIATPGVGIASSFSHHARDLEVSGKCDSYWTTGFYHYGTNRVLPGEEAMVIQGTSMACPNATGAIALLLQKNATLDDGCLRQVFAGSAVKDTVVTTRLNVAGTAMTDTALGDGAPNSDWGEGRMDISAALTFLDTQGYACAPPAGCTDNADCDDGVFCNGAETCDASGQCQPGTVPCSDGVSCTDDVCNEASDSCVYPDNCQGGDACNTPSCDMNTGSCVLMPQTGTGCEDGDVCTLNDTCSNGICVPGTLVLNCTTCVARGDTCSVSADCCPGMTCHPRKKYCK